MSLDITVQDHGSLLILVPVTDTGKAWLVLHLAGAVRWGKGYVVEPPYRHDIFIGAVDDGLEIERE